MQRTYNTRRFFRVIDTKHPENEPFEGTIDQVCKYANVTEAAVRSAIDWQKKSSRFRQVDRRYNIIDIGMQDLSAENLKKIKSEEKKLSKRELKINYLIFHLNTYGNTVLMEDPSKYKTAVNKAGVEFEWTCYPRTARHRKHYILRKVGA